MILPTMLYQITTPSYGTHLNYTVSRGHPEASGLGYKYLESRPQMPANLYDALLHS